MFEQDRVLTRIQQYVQRDGDIYAAFASGSYGKRTHDPYSDLDIALVYATDSARETAFARRRELVKAIMPYVPAKSFDADHIRPFFHIALYSNGTKVDYRFESLDSLTPNPWDREIKLLKDSGGWGAAFQAACAALALPRPTISAAALTALDDRFWVMFWDTYRLVLRGEHDKPFPIFLQLFTLTFEQLLPLLPPDDPARQAIFPIHFGRDQAENQRQLAQLLDVYRQLRAAIVQRHNLMFEPNHAFERELSRKIR